MSNTEPGQAGHGDPDNFGAELLQAVLECEEEEEEAGSGIQALGHVENVFSVDDRCVLPAVWGRRTPQRVAL